jgi:cell division transport system permease protein
MSRALYFLQEAGLYLRENKMASAMTTMTISFTMLIFGLFLLLYLNVSVLMVNVQSEIKILLYLDENNTSNQVAQIRKKLETESAISGMLFISKEQAVDDFKKSMKGNELLLKGLGENPLPASFELTVDPVYRSSEAMARLVDRLREIPGIEEIQYGREWVETVESWLGLFRIGALGIGVILALTVTAIIANTIQLTLLSRRNEMEILRLIGATRSFIGIPFLLEGALISFVSSGLAILMLIGLHQLVLQNLIAGRGGGLKEEWLLFLPAPWISGLLLMGVGLGFIGSYWSFRRWI